MISTLSELRTRVPTILARINADPGLAVGAAANPLLALEELGEELSPSLKPVVERRVRFSREHARRLDSLAREVRDASGVRCDLDDPAELARMLFIDLGLTPPGRRRQVTEVTPELRRLAEPLPFDPDPQRRDREDPLARLAGKHPAIAPLLAYRELDAFQPRLASQELYDEVRSGKHGVPVSNLRGHLTQTPAPQSASRGSRRGGGTGSDA